MLPNGKLIYFNNSLYYNNQAVGKTTINTYTISLSNIAIQGTFNTQTTSLPIQNIKNRFIEYWYIELIDEISGTQYFNVKYDEYFNTTYVAIEINTSNTKIGGAYVMFYNQYSYDIDNNQNIKIGTTICANNNNYDELHFNIQYTCLYFA